MLVRLLLALLLAAFALPAMAAAPCHDGAPMAMRMTTGHHAPAAPEHQAAAMHDCIGCIPPSSLVPGAAAAPPLAVAAAPVARIATLDLASGVPPATPPPRRIA